MPLFRTISLSQGLIGVWQLLESVNDLLPEFLAEELSDPLFTKYTHNRRKVEWLATRLLLKEMIGPEFSISYLASGKPILNHDTFKTISITHSRDFVAIIIHQSKHVGIDIEDTNRDFRRIEKRFLSDRELDFVAGDDQLKCLFWCAKEAVFKLVEDEGIEFKEQIIVSPNREQENRFSAKFLNKGKNTDYQLNYDSFSGNCMVWVVE